MKFIVQFVGESGKSVCLEGRTLGTKDLEEVRKNRKWRIEGYTLVDNIARFEQNAEIELSECEASKIALFDTQCRVTVKTKEAQLNNFVTGKWDYTLINIEHIACTLIFGDIQVYYKQWVDRARLLDEWIKADCPLDWREPVTK